MPQKIYIGNFSKGLKTDRLPFVIDNDAFPVLENAYSWRGRIKKRRGTGPIGQLTLTEDATAEHYPVMGLRDFFQGGNTYPLLLAFDTHYAYQLNQTMPIPFFYSVSFYKGTGAAIAWTGADYQQFWTVNYQGALWATNGVPGLNISSGISNITQGDSTHLTITVANTAAIGDYIFVWEVVETVVIGQLKLNGVSGKVTAASGSSVTILVPSGTYNTYVSGGIIQYLTQSTGGGDGIRWYDGDPTGGTGTGPSGLTGWVNFSPPLSMGTFGFDDFLPNQYYLAGATAILPFKDRLLFFGPWIQAKTGAAIHLIDTVLWSWNGTPYYSQPTPNVNSSVVYGYDPTAYEVDVTGKGGYLSAGIAQQINTVNLNEDVVLVGFTNRQSRLVYTGNDLSPFLFYSINSELGAISTFSGITLDRGALSIGRDGLVLTSQTNTQRIDLDIPYQVFDIAPQTGNEGAQRVNAARDFYNEWIYFTYPSIESNWIYPTKTLNYNYRDNTWAIFYENYTTHGSFRKLVIGLTWETVDQTFPTWSSWDQPWNSSTTVIGSPTVCAGNQQGFVVNLAQGTSESPSGWVNTITVASPLTLTINSPNHCLMQGGPNIPVGDYLQLSNMTGATMLNGLIGSVGIIVTDSMGLSTADPDNFNLTFSEPHGYTSGYTSGGVFARLCQPFFQSKQFPIFWEEGMAARLGAQRYLFTRTSEGQITVNIYLSQNPNDPTTDTPILPDQNSINDSLIYSNLVFTSPEIPITSISNYSLGPLGNGANLTLNLSLTYPIIPGSVIINIGTIATFTDNGSGGFNVTGTAVSSGSSIAYGTGQVVLVFSSAPNRVYSTASYQYTTQNIQTPNPPAGAQSQIWHRINNSLIGESVQLGFTLSDLQMRNEEYVEAEIELHGIVLDLYPGPLLA